MNILTEQQSKHSSSPYAISLLVNIPIEYWLSERILFTVWQFGTQLWLNLLEQLPCKIGSTVRMLQPSGSSIVLSKVMLQKSGRSLGSFLAFQPCLMTSCFSYQCHGRYISPKYSTTRELVLIPSLFIQNMPTPFVWILKW